jgi:hypothetical protein
MSGPLASIAKDLHRGGNLVLLAASNCAAATSLACFNLARFNFACSLAADILSKKGSDAGLP